MQTLLEAEEEFDVRTTASSKDKDEEAGTKGWEEVRR
jgi:hypothetical protein